MQDVYIDLKDYFHVRIVEDVLMLYLMSFILIILLYNIKQLGLIILLPPMNNAQSTNNTTYYNEFVDMKQIFPMRSRQKNRINNHQNIKIATKKLPPDFFRPHTRENPVTLQDRDRQTGVQTPCFGDQKKQSSSLSLIPKQKRNIEYHERRIQTLPVHQHQNSYKESTRKNQTQEHSRNQQQLSYRQSNTRSLVPTQSRHRQKIKYKKLTLNDELYFDQKKMLNLQYENRIRLNIKKFFQQETEMSAPEIAPKSARRVVVPLDKISSTELPYKLKIKKLPPLL